ncbi:MAG TPA: glycosyltransferase family 39 protein [Acidimicrobiales bacterium]|jgi:4-amino-4-deoxy-L-arabinose transferase-like glycosyltransferase|nr:glycosyltransferase family 39 protein [Acidimicrobiales bacterium]
MSTIAPPSPEAAAPVESHPTARRLPGLVRGRAGDPTWVRPCLLALLAATAVLYLWGLGASGWANAFYSAAAQAGSKSWTAFFFGSSDAANFITVDKAPAALWLMDLSARIFGVNAWSILVPEALAGVASVGLLYATVRRAARPGAGLLAGAVLALTPVASLMFRFNNPDALLVLLLIGSAYAMTRAVESGRTRWLVLAGALVGFGFLAKMLQALLLVPALGLTYLVAGPTPLRRRIVQLLAGAGAMVAGAGWWIAVVQLIPASSRPYIGGSQNNSLWNLMFGYNGFGRLTGDEVGSVGGGGGQGGRWGLTGLGRLANAEFGSQIAWLLPAALIFLVAGLVISRRVSRTNRTRAALLLWGGWLVVTALTFSLGKGIIHPYYSVALAPPIGALVGIGGSLLWARRHDPVARSVLAATLAVSALWSATLLSRTPRWYPGLRTGIAVAGLILSAALLAVPHLGRWGSRAVAAGAVVVALAGPGAYSVATAATPHTGAIPSAGPAGTGTGRFGPGGNPPGGAAGANRGGGGIGGLLNGTTPSAALVTYLRQDSDRYTWVAATVGSNNAAGYQLGTGDPVMAIGGFNGTDPAPTLVQFQADVAAGRIHFFLASGGGGFGGGGPGAGTTTTVSTASQITSWVTGHFTPATVDGATVYDLTAPVAS